LIKIFFINRNDENAIKLPDDPQGAKKVSDGKKTKVEKLFFLL
jgi:hypothetical protein